MRNKYLLEKKRKKVCNVTAQACYIFLVNISSSLQDLFDKGEAIIFFIKAKIKDSLWSRMQKIRMNFKAKAQASRNASAYAPPPDFSKGTVLKIIRKHGVVKDPFPKRSG